MRFLVGTSGYQYKEWKGAFYPDDLSTDQMLLYYAARFPTVEINNTFYRIPKAGVVERWAEQVPDEFRFVLKASQRITHYGRLRNVADTLSYFLEVSSALGPKRGPTLFQLPPNMKQDLERLNDFLRLLPHGWPAAMEFRHASWFDDAVYAALRERDVALCVADTDEGETPVVSTAQWGYVRLRRERYTDADLTRWVDTVRHQAWREAYVFFKHEDAGAGPALGRRFMQVAGVSNER